jgi:hypothetical protein
VVVVVVVTERVGAGGGGEDTMFDWGPVSQPARMARVPKQAMTEVSRRATRMEVGRDGRKLIFIFIFLGYAWIGSSTMGCSTDDPTRSG